jgi:hypothetical protein
MTLRLSVLVAAVLSAGLLVDLALAQNIYTCVDEKGRKLTSDRPIVECLDRPQRELNASGTVRRVLTPQASAKERAALDEKEKLDAEAKLQQMQEKRHDRALFKRYPDAASHDKARTAALDLVDDAMKVTAKRLDDLTAQRRVIMNELDFYKNSPEKTPPALKRRLDETDGNMALQKQLMADKEADRARINAKFDAEAGRLKPQWSIVSAGEAPATPKKP